MHWTGTQLSYALHPVHGFLQNNHMESDTRCIYKKKQRTAFAENALALHINICTALNIVHGESPCVVLVRYRRRAEQPEP